MASFCHVQTAGELMLLADRLELATSRSNGVLRWMCPLKFGASYRLHRDRPSKRFITIIEVRENYSQFSNSGKILMYREKEGFRKFSMMLVFRIQYKIWVFIFFLVKLCNNSLFFLLGLWWIYKNILKYWTSIKFSITWKLNIVQKKPSICIANWPHFFG